ncbi:jg15329 [Pararge aegeria aegeria]|uniref:Jg15329 protein n=1 Tax=Pararge aegeria aegeria TaxID=348720 RepID=A0A8S4RJ49_9NEOP|nr:jg15329 [Pararge aegeria aegeria]
MRCEMPILLRCCFCFPLRYGLLVWAYVKQISSLIFLAYLIFMFCLEHWRMNVGTRVWLSLMITLTIVDILFHLLFIISAHKKNYRIMRMFYRYSIFLLCVTMTNMALYNGSWNSRTCT